MDSGRIEKSPNGFNIYGSINFDTVSHIYKQGAELLKSSKVVVQLDFSEVSHADSSAIALLLNWIRFAKKTGKSFVFLNLPGQLLEIANVCEVMPFLQQYLKSHQKGEVFEALS